MDIEADSPRRVTRSMTRERLSDAMTGILTRARKATLLAKQSLGEIVRKIPSKKRKTKAGKTRFNFDYLMANSSTVIPPRPPAPLVRRLDEMKSITRVFSG